MKIQVLCMGRGSTIKTMGDQEVVVYYIDFAVKREKNPAQQQYFGQMHFESAEAFHYKVNKEYQMDLAEVNIFVPDQRQIKNALVNAN